MCRRPDSGTIYWERCVITMVTVPEWHEKTEGSAHRSMRFMEIKIPAETKIYAIKRTGLTCQSNGNPPLSESTLVRSQLETDANESRLEVVLPLVPNFPMGYVHARMTRSRSSTSMMIASSMPPSPTPLSRSLVTARLVWRKPGFVGMPGRRSRDRVGFG